MELDFSRLDGIEVGAARGGEAQGMDGMARLEAEAETAITAITAYRAYQRNIAQAGALRAEILLGAKAGEGTRSLLMKAARAISLMTGDTLFYDQVERDVGAGER